MALLLGDVAGGSLNVMMVSDWWGMDRILLLNEDGKPGEPMATVGGGNWKHDDGEDVVADTTYSKYTKT